MLANRQVEALNEGRVDVPAVRGQHLLDGRQRAEHDAVAYADQAPPAHGLDDLRIEQLRQWHPARLRRRAGGPAAWGLDPLAKVRQSCGGILLESVRQKPWDTALGQHLHDLM